MVELTSISSQVNRGAVATQSAKDETQRGTVLGGGGDWVTAVADGIFELDFRVTLETDDGALSQT